MSIQNSISEEELNLIVDKYINAEDIDGYSIDDLENDPVFMMRVIMKTNDKKVFYLCSDAVCKDFGFIKFLIEKFKNTQYFVDEIIFHYYTISDEVEKCNYDILNYFLNVVSDQALLHDEVLYFLKNSDNEIEKLELSIKLAGNVDVFPECVIIANSKILSKLVDFSIVKNQLDDNVKKRVGLGFVFVGDSFDFNETIMNAFAKTYLNNIFYEDKMSIEEFLHTSFTSKESIIKYGVNAFISDYIKNKDEFLAEYVLVRKDLIQPIIKEFNMALDNWENFEEKTENNRIGIIYEKAKKYHEEHDTSIRFLYFDAVYYVAKKLGYHLHFDRYNLKTYYKDREELYDNDLSLILMFEDDFNLAEIAYLKYLENLIRELFKTRVIIEEYDDYLEPERKEAKFFEFPQNIAKVK